MATFYAIHAYDQESKYHSDEDKIDNQKLYTTFEKACDAIEKKIGDYIEYWNNHESDTPEEFEPPNREDKAKYIAKRPYVHYHECNSGWLWVISKMTVEEDPPKKYTYQYYIENCNTYRTYTTLSGEKGVHEPKKSKVFDSFDEAIDAMDKELRELHVAIGKYWEPRMNREAFKTYMGDHVASTYDFFNDGGPITDTYVLVRQEA